VHRRKPADRLLRRTGWPGHDLLQPRVSDDADQIGRDVDVVQLAQMPDDLAGTHTAGVHRDDLVVEPRKFPLILGDQLGIEAGLAVPRHRQLDLSSVWDDGPLAIRIPLLAEMISVWPRHGLPILTLSLIAHELLEEFRNGLARRRFNPPPKFYFYVS